MRYLLDTCALSELIKARRDAGVLNWLAERNEASLFVSVISLAELTKGVYQLAETSRQKRIRAWIQDDLKPRFAERLLAIEPEIAETWGEISGEAARCGTPLPMVDAWIAATAIRHRLTV